MNSARRVSTMGYHENNFRTEYSRNEIVNKKLITRLVDQSSIGKGDLVYDIGAGSGAISEALLKKGARVIAVEKDKEIYRKCKQRLIGQDRFELYLDDFLIMDFPPESTYKVFSNIPFIRTADIVNRLLFNANPPSDCYLVLQREAANRYAGLPRETLASLLLKPVFWVDIVYHFNRKDFFPVPSVDIVLLQVEKRRSRLVPEQHYGLYRDFIVFCREEADRTVKKSLKRLFTYSQLKQLSRLLNIDYRSSPTELNFVQYLAIFQFYLNLYLKNPALSVRGAEEEYLKHQEGRVKTHRTGEKIKGRTTTG
jgi:23S rRNA (adenine-N6)-dimethyltransferase